MVSEDGLAGDVYEIKTLPNTALQLVNAIYKQKDLSRKEAREMAEYLDKRYSMSDHILIMHQYTDGELEEELKR